MNTGLEELAAAQLAQERAVLVTLDWIRGLPGPALTTLGHNVLVTLAQHVAAGCCDETRHYCWPSLATIAAESRLHVSSVKRGLSQLSAAGLIQVSERWPDSKRTGALYRLAVRPAPGQPLLKVLHDDS